MLWVREFFWIHLYAFSLPTISSSLLHPTNQYPFPAENVSTFSKPVDNLYIIVQDHFGGKCPIDLTRQPPFPLALTRLCYFAGQEIYEQEYLSQAN